MPDLINDFRDRDLGAEIIAHDPNSDPMRVGTSRHLTEQRGLQRAPVAAMDEEGERRRNLRLGRKQVNRLPQCRAVAQTQLGAALLHGLSPVVLGFPSPPRKNIRMLRNAGTIVVLDLVVDWHPSTP